MSPLCIFVLELQLPAKLLELNSKSVIPANDPIQDGIDPTQTLLDNTHN